MYFAKALAIFRVSAAEFDAASVAINLAEAEFRAGYAETAVRISTEVLPIAYALNQRLWVAALHHNMAAYLVTLARYEDARSHALIALDLAGQLQIKVLVLWTLQHLAAVAALRTRKQSDGQACDGYESAARLLGFTVARFAVLGTPQEHTERQEYDCVLGVLREATSSDLLGELMACGATMSEEEAVEFSKSSVNA